MMLYYTPVLFSTIAFHAFLIGRNIVGLGWLIQNQASIIHYLHDADPSRHVADKLLHNIDRAVACINWVYALWIAVDMEYIPILSWIIWLSLLYTFMIYHLYLSHMDRECRWPYNPDVVRAHKTLHIVSAIGLHTLLIADKK